MKIINLIDKTKQSAHLEQFAVDVLVGLSAIPKSLSSKYFYDDIGSDLFQKITKHEDYYPTRTEFSILESIQNKLPDILDEKELDILELGAGDGHKTSLILNGFLESGYKINYYPIDISEQAMLQLKDNMDEHENLTICGVIAEYFEGLRHVRKQSENKALVLFLGSNIGNFDRIQNQGFLRAIWQSLKPEDYMLIGFDLKKPVNILTAAYNDSSSFTRDFNLNILHRINTELGGDFDLNKFEHYGIYNPVLGTMESYLFSLEPQVVYIENLQRSFTFDAYEPLHLEYSFKFLESDINYLADKTGYQSINNFTDDNNYFIDTLWRVSKDQTKP